MQQVMTNLLPSSPARCFHRILLASSLSLLFTVSTSYGHDIDVTGVARLFLDEYVPTNAMASNTSVTHYRLSVVDQQVPPLLNLQYSLPEQCTAAAPSRYSYRFFCDQALSIEDQLTFPWRLQGVVMVTQWQDGSEASGYFPGDGNFIEVPLDALKADGGSLSSLASRYLVLGAEHILFGLDHLLFVLAILLLISGFLPLLKTITAFTLAHSITLAIAVLGIFPVPSAPVEAIIALSILFLAREVVLSVSQQEFSPRSLAQNKPWIVAFLFGLIHGFGFAGALGELGLQSADIPPALLFFNLGVELGQIAFIATVLVSAQLLLHSIKKVVSQFSSTSSDAVMLGNVQFVKQTLAYSLGAIAMFWFIERLPAVFAASA